MKYFFEVDIFIDDRLKEFHSVFAVIWRKTSNHLMNETAKTPPININSMPSFLNDFRSQILRSSADWHRDTFFRVEYFRETKISQLNISLMVNDNILGFETKLAKGFTLCIWSYSYEVLPTPVRFMLRRI